jgi:hypothetical protein
MVVVVVQPPRIVGYAGLFGVVGGCVRPLGCERPVESFDLPIRLRPVGAGAAMLGFFQRCGEQLRAVARAVVCHHRADADAGIGEEGAGSLPEGGSCLFALVVQDFGVGEPGMVVDGVVEVGVAAAGLGVVTGALLSPDGAVPSAVGDASELLDVEVNEIARLGGLASPKLRLSR